MDADRIDRVTGWDSESFSDGFDGLRALADRDFSGAVTDGAAWLFMLNGRVVGVVDGTLEGFETASGTAYEAPHESLPLLYAMLEEGGRERAQYYTNDTPLADADRKLSAGNFTGYVELSENVLSGDYYVAYYGGESLSAAFTGSSNDTLKTGEEAFDLANDEVGIYTVHEVDLDVRQVPDPDDVGSTGVAGGTETVDGSDTAASSDTDSTDTDTDSDDHGLGNVAAGVGGGVTVDDAEDDPATDEADATTDRSGPVDPAPSAAVDDAGESGEMDDSPSADAGTETDEPETKTDEPETEPAERTAPDTGANSAGGEAGTPTDGAASGSPDASSATDSSATPSTESEEEDGSVTKGDVPPNADEDVFSEEEEWRETKSIPALDPDESADVVREQESGSAARSSRSSAGTGATDGRSSSASGSKQATSGKQAASSKQAAASASTADSSAAGSTRSEKTASTGEANGSGAGAGSEDVNERESVKRSQLHRRVNRLESALEETEAKRKALVEERDEVAAERDELRETNERLESRVAELESELESVRGELREARAQLPDGDQMMSPADALDGTNLFVRYGSQGGATLEKARDDEVDREELVNNLQLEHHTSFEADGVVVDDQPYEAFLRDTMEYGFTRWLVEDLLFEIQDTGNTGDLQELYEAIPEIDRAEIGGTVQIVHQENGEETREQRSFDLVLRNRMGNPLFVADLNASRDPTAKGSLDQLVEDSSLVAESGDEFASAFAVTSSFFKPGALETADDATGGGLLSRSKKKSYVKISRKQGYHLCLAESRDGGFHLTVPEL
ncbi:DUF7527 domain-containing protein [Haloparvum sp. AD34]